MAMSVEELDATVRSFYEGRGETVSSEVGYSYDLSALTVLFIAKKC